LARVQLLFILAVPFLLAGCYSDQKKQLASCKAGATRVGSGQPFKAIQACMDQAGYRFVGYANPDGPTVVCDLPAVIQGTPSATDTDALCFEPRGRLALWLYRWQVPDRGVKQSS
jgi:hypothetical protein